MLPGAVIHSVLASRDVIHSFWAPNLQGKRDLIPGYITAIWLQADQPGILRGQCAEFCGLQHAHMALDIVAEPEADFQRWLESLRRSAPEPQTDEQAARPRKRGNARGGDETPSHRWLCAL